jgi:hypothetical protein
MQEPSRQLGWWTAVNNTLTQVFLKIRAIFIFFGIAVGLGTVASIFLWNGLNKTEISIFNTYVEILKMGRLPEWKFTKFLLSIVFRIIEHSLFLSVFIFIVIFYGYKILTDKMYEKKYIRGLKILKPKILIKLINEKE